MFTLFKDIQSCQQNLNVNMLISFELFIHNKNIFLGWTEWTTFNETNRVRYRKCNNDTFGQVKGLLI